MKTLECILITILFVLTLKITVDYTTYQCIKYFDYKIELIQNSQYLQGRYLDYLAKKLNRVELNKVDSIKSLKAN